MKRQAKAQGKGDWGQGHTSEVWAGGDGSAECCQHRGVTACELVWDWASAPSAFPVEAAFIPAGRSWGTAGTGKTDNATPEHNVTDS